MNVFPQKGFKNIINKFYTLKEHEEGMNRKKEIWDNFSKIMNLPFVPSHDFTFV